MSTCMTPSASDMLALWKLSRYYEPMRCDCEVARLDGIDLDALLSLEMRSWYASMLTELSDAELPLTDITALLTVTPAEGGLAAAIPETVMRIVTVEAEGWTSPARIVTDLTLPVNVALTNPFSCPQGAAPAVEIHPGVMTLRSPGGKPLKLRRVLAAVMPDAEGPYPLSPAMLAELTDKSY